MKSYDTISAAIAGLKAKGYSLDFNISFDTIKCDEHNICLNPSEFEITEVHRFEGETNPSDEEVLYAIQSKDGKQRGTFVSAFGIYADAVSNDMLQKLSIQH
ncbi:MAG TPA: phosphoribosylpyrophosphate synthetase [Ferruginibacter sp.]|nr:phosphoribosylpyrophosphate synthetase [Ferruginibacter sp.]HMP21164.1 phosphoribosylpyrophosphate synthetase [Ferruginibacter sp.]